MDPYIYTIDEGQVAGRPAPGRIPWDLEAIKKAGFTTIVSFECERIDGDEIRDAGLEHIRICVEDFRPPTQDQLRRFNEIVDERVSRGGRVLTHCWAGRGRTGTFLSARLVWKGTPARDAIAEIRSKIVETQGTLAGAIEPAQEESLYQFEKSLRRVTKP